MQKKIITLVCYWIFLPPQIHFNKFRARYLHTGRQGHGEIRTGTGKEFVGGIKAAWLSQDVSEVFGLTNLYNTTLRSNRKSGFK